MSEAADWVETYRAFWEVQLGALARLFEPEAAPGAARSVRCSTPNGETE